VGEGSGVGAVVTVGKLVEVAVAEAIGSLVAVGSGGVGVAVGVADGGGVGEAGGTGIGLGVWLASTVGRSSTGAGVDVLPWAICTVALTGVLLPPTPVQPTRAPIRRRSITIRPGTRGMKGTLILRWPFQ
jgi:hypothetical protein